MTDRGRALEVRGAAVRLAVQTALLVLACLVVVGLVVYVYHEQTERRAADQRLRETTANVDSVREAPSGVALVIIEGDRQEQTADLPTGFPDTAMIERAQASGRPVEEEVHRNGEDYTVRTEVHGGRVVQAVLQQSLIDEEQERILGSLLVAGVVGLVLSGLVAVVLARQAIAPLAQTLALQRRFVADASHELRTPLTLLSTRVQLLARRLRGDPAAEHLRADVDGVLADTRALTDLLDELLASADTRALQVEELDLRELCRECVAAVAAHASERQLVVHLDPGDPVPILGSPTALRRAVLALVDNALEHAASEVRLSLESTRRAVVLTVRDDGPGIPSDVLPHVFDRFSGERPAADPGSRRHYGIGLALVADIAARHHGAVHAGTAPGGGAELQLRLTPTRQKDVPGRR